MPGFTAILLSSRPTEPHLPTLLAQLQTLDPTAGLAHRLGSDEYVVKKATQWTAPQRAAAQNAIDTAPEISPALIAREEITRWPISMQALAEALVDEINVLRTALALAPRTPAQVITGIKNKATEIAARAIVFLVLASSAWAQGTTAQLTSTTCPGTGCVALVLTGGGQGSAHVAGTWVGTLAFEKAESPCTSYAAQPVLPVTGAPVAISTTTVNGAWYFSAAATNCIRVRFSSYTSGTAQVTLFAGPASGGGGGGGGGASVGLTAAELDARLPLPVDAEVTAMVDTTGLATDTGQTTGNTSLASIDGKLPALSSGRVPVVLPAGGGGLTDAELRAAAVPVSLASAPTTPVTGPLTDAQLRASAVPVSGTFYQATQPVSGPLTDAQLRAAEVPVSLATVPSHAVTGPLTDTQLRASAVPVSGPLTDTQLRASAVPVSLASVPSHPVTNAGTFPVQLSSALPAGANTIGNIGNTAFGATPPTLTKGTQGATGFSVQALTDAGRSSVALTFTTTAPTTADTVVTALIKSTGGSAAAGAQSITAAASKTLRLVAANAQIRTTTAALPWALVTLRMSSTTTCTASSSVVAYLSQGGTAAVAGNVGQFSTQFPDGFELVAGGSFCISVSGNVTTNVLTFSAQGYEY